MPKLSDFLKDESGATAIEYALLAGLISIGVISSLTIIGRTTSNTFVAVNNGFTPATR